MRPFAIRYPLLLVSCIAVACTHEAPFAFDPGPVADPLVGLSPAQLTFNPLTDTGAAWSPDGTILYTARRADHKGDSCLEVLPGTGGRVIRSLCAVHHPGDDSIASFESAAESPAGRLAFIRSARRPLEIGWSRRLLEVMEPDGTLRIVTRLPAAGVPVHAGMSHAWFLDEHRLVYLAETYAQFRACNGCPFVDSVRGLYAMLVDLSTDPATFTVVPQTDDASSVAPIGTDSLLFTRYADTRVYVVPLSGGTPSVFHDFGPSLVTDVQWEAGRLLVIANGLVMVDSGATAATRIDTLGWESARLSRDGRHVVAGRSSNLWLVDLP